VLQIAAGYKARWFWAFFFLALAAGATLSVPYVFRVLVDQGTQDLSALHQPFLMLLGVSVVLAIATALRFYFMSWLGERVVADLRERVYARVLRQPPAYFETLQTGEVLSRLTADTTLVQTLVGTSISLSLRSLVLFAGGVTMMLLTSPFLAGLMVVLLVLVILPVLALGRKVRAVSKDSQDRVADTSALAGEVLNAMTTVQAFGREAYEQARYAKTVADAFVTARRRNTTRSLLTAVAIVLAFGVIVFVLWLGAREVVAGTMSAGQLAQFVLYAVLTAGSIAALAEVWGDLQRAAGATERLVALMTASPALENPLAVHPQSVDLPVTASAGATAPPLHSLGSLGAPIRIRFEGVWFAYPSRPNDWAIADLSFDLTAGQTFALVGPSGAGKSTVLQLLLGFYQPQRGRILFNERPITDWGLAAVRAAIALVPQDPVIFSDNAWGNIRYGRLEADDEAVKAAARAAHADGFLTSLPQGYDTFLGERGLRLSGGQRQRLAIARAVLRNPPVLLLDEATSALDALSERAVQQALEALLPGRTAVVVAHRLSTVRKAHQIVVLDAGRRVAQASHAELLQDCPLYRELAMHQFLDAASTPEEPRP
jgi:ATP-binding cassette, subfamily B, bacterial